MRRLPDSVNYLLQALSYLGKDSIDNDIIQRCAARLDSRDVPFKGIFIHEQACEQLATQNPANTGVSGKEKPLNIAVRAVRK